MAVVIDVSSMDFPDGAQRFNWCTCQDAEKKLARTLGAMPKNYILGQADAITPIVDFSFWSDLLGGGGGSIPTAAPTVAPAPLTISTPVGSIGFPSWLIYAVVGVLGAMFLFRRARGGGRSRGRR